MVSLDDHSQYNDGVYSVPTEGWVADIERVQALCPSVTEELVRQHFEAVPGKSNRALSRGFAHIASLRSIDLKLHTSPVADRPGVHCVQLQMHASMKACDYRATLFLETVPSNDACNVPQATSILRAVCEPVGNGEPCAASGSGDNHGGFVNGACSHVSAATQAVVNLLRPPGIIGVKQVCTSTLCRWNVPGEGEAFPVQTLLADILFEKPCRDRTTTRQTCPAVQTSNRPKLNPFANPQDNRRDTDNRIAKRRKLYASLRKDFAKFKAAVPGVNGARLGNRAPPLSAH